MNENAINQLLKLDQKLLLLAKPTPAVSAEREYGTCTAKSLSITNWKD